jgi:hypothetical protein
MQIKYLLFFLILCWTAFGYAQQVDSSSAPDIKPGLIFSEMEYDFGTIKSDSIVSHVYTFKNTTLDTIKINKVGTS